MIGVCLFIVSSSAMAWNEQEITLTSDNFTGLKIHSSHHTASMVRNIPLLRVSDLAHDCSIGVFFDEDNSYVKAVALAVFVSSGKAILKYDVDTRSPWGDTKICALTGIEMIR